MCYMRNNNDDANDIQWSLEKGYPTPKTEFPLRAEFGPMAYFHPYISDIDRENVCEAKTSRVFFHKPNEILTPYHEAINLRYVDVSFFSTLASQSALNFYA